MFRPYSVAPITPITPANILPSLGANNQPVKKMTKEGIVPLGPAPKGGITPSDITLLGGQPVTTSGGQPVTGPPQSLGELPSAINIDAPELDIFYRSEGYPFDFYAGLKDPFMKGNIDENSFLITSKLYDFNQGEAAYLNNAGDPTIGQNPFLNPMTQQPQQLGSVESVKLNVDPNDMQYTDGTDQMLQLQAEYDVNPLTGKPYGDGSLDHSIDGTVLTADGQKGMTVLPPASPGQLEVGDKGIQGPSIDTNIKAPNTLGTPENIEDAAKQELNNKLVSDAMGQEPFDAERYYLFKGTLDTAALMRNMMQEPPPGQYFKRPHLERIRMDRQPYEDARQQVREQGRTSYRGARESLSQMSDFIKMNQAVTAGTQEALSNIGSAEAQQELQVDLQNQQIANQENMMQTEIANQEMGINYQMQAEAQRYKDAMISQQLARIGDTVGAYAMYKNQKEQAMRQEELSKRQTNLVNELQMNWMKYEATKTELASQGYQEAEKKAVNNYIQEQQKALLESDDFKILREEFGDDYDPLTANIRAKKYKMEKQQLDYNQALIDQGIERNKDMDDIAWTEAQEKFEDLKKKTAELAEVVDKDKAIYEAEKAFYDRVRNDFNISGARQNFQTEYLRQAGLPTSSEFIQSVESAIAASRQL